MNRLRVRIVSTFLVLVTLAMLLIDFAITGIHLQNTVQSKIEGAIDAVLSIASVQIPREVDACRFEYEYLQILNDVLGKDCLLISVWHEKSLRNGAASIGDVELLHLLDGMIVEEVVVKKIKTSNKKGWLPNTLIFIGVPLKCNVDGKITVGILLSIAQIKKNLLQNHSTVFTFIFINAFIFSVIVFYRVKKALFDPVGRLVRVADTFHIDEGFGMFPEQSHDELGQLSRAMNSMLARIKKDRVHLRETADSLAIANKSLIEAQNEIVRAEKFAAVGRLSAGLAHEIGNPLAIAQGYLEILDRQADLHEEQGQFIKICLAELNRIDQLVQKLMDVSREKEVRHRKVDVKIIVAELFNVLKTNFMKNSIQAICSSPEEPVEIFADKESIRQVILNILLNAVDAVNDVIDNVAEKKITVRLVNNHVDKKTIIEITDTGTGIPEDEVDKIFEPFHTTKPPGKGTGLGLSVSYKIVRSFGGRIEVESECGKGTVFRIIFQDNEEV